MMADELVKSGSYYNAIDIYLQEFNEDGEPYVAFHLADAYFKARDYKNLRHGFRRLSNSIRQTFRKPSITMLSA